MDIKVIKDHLTNCLSEFEGLLTYTEEIDEKQKSTDRQYKILLQKENAVAKKNKLIAKDLETIETEQKRIIDQKAEIERGFELIDKQKKDFTQKMGEMRTFQSELDEKLAKVKEIEQREVEVNQQELDLAEKSKKIAHREGLVAKEKEILRERKTQLDALEEKRKAKLEKLNKMLGE